MQISPSTTQRVLLWDVRNSDPAKSIDRAACLDFSFNLPASMLILPRLDPFKEPVVKFYAKPVTHLASKDLQVICTEIARIFSSAKIF